MHRAIMVKILVSNVLSFGRISQVLVQSIARDTSFVILKLNLNFRYEWLKSWLSQRHAEISTELVLVGKRFDLGLCENILAHVIVVKGNPET